MSNHPAFTQSWPSSRQQSYNHNSAHITSGGLVDSYSNASRQSVSYSPNYRSPHIHPSSHFMLEYPDIDDLMTWRKMSSTRPAIALETYGLAQDSFHVQGRPAIVHHVVHHVQAPQQFHQVQHSPWLRQSQAVPRQKDTSRDPIAHAFSKALDAIGDNGRRITNKRVSNRPPPRIQRKRTKTSRPSPDTFPKDCEIIEIDNSDDEREDGRNTPESSTRSDAAQVLEIADSSPTTGADREYEITSAIGSETISDQTETSSKVSNSTEKALGASSGQECSDTSKSDLDLADEVGLRTILVKLQADLEVLLEGLQGLPEGPLKTEYNRIIRELYIRARRDAHHEMHIPFEGRAENVL